MHGTFLDDTAEPETGFVVRPARAEEVLAVFGGGMRHMAATVNGRFIGMVSMRRIDGRLWGMLTILAKPDDLSDRFAVVNALRTELKKYREPIYVTQEFEAAQVLLRLLGFVQTPETMGHRHVWKWTPAKMKEQAA